jgi:(2R)-sulfolactate sulfo-lyase subunit alpha
MKYGILIHAADDDVGVAVMDLTAGSEIGAATLEGQPVGSLLVIQDIPFGHKIAMRDLALEAQVIEYGQAIGRATMAITRGEHVHVHNLRTLRWQ